MNVHQKILDRHGRNATSEFPSDAVPTELARQPSNPSEPAKLNNEELFIQQQLEMLQQFNAFSNIRVSSQVFPKSRQVAQDSNIPMVAMIQPYGQSVYEGAPSTSYGNFSIVRCEQCKAYISPFVSFPNKGYEMICNLCRFQSPVPTYYYCDVDPNTQQRTDRDHRPELHLGSYDIKAGQEYQARPPMPPTYMFMIDCSQASQNLGILTLFSQTLITIINQNQLQGNSRTMFGIITYDTGIQVYNLNPSLKSPKIFCLTDLVDLELPLPEDFLVNLEESKDLILALLEQFNTSFQHPRAAYATCFSKAIQVARMVMGHYGGKLIILTASTNIQHDPALLPKVQQTTRNYMYPTSPTLSAMANEMQHSFICPSIFVFSGQYVNALTLVELTRFLNGEIHYYRKDDNDSQQKQFYYDLYKVLTRDYTWESVFRVRVSNGFRIKHVYGQYSVKSNDLLNITCLDDKKTLTYEFEFEGPQSRLDVMYLQKTALLYTSCKGERRIRVHNYGLPLSFNALVIHKHADANVLASFICKRVLYDFTRSPSLQNLRTTIIETTKNIMKSAVICNKVSTQIHPQGIVPSSLESLIMNVLGLMKSNFMTNVYEPDQATDLANIQRQLLTFLGPDDLMIHLVPYLIRIDDLVEGTCIYTDDGQFTYPQLQTLDVEVLQQGGLFLMDTGSNLILYITKNHDEALIKDVLGVTSEIFSFGKMPQLNEDMLYHNSLNQVNTRLYNLITELRSRKYTGYVPLQIVISGDPKTQYYEQTFLRNLILDDVASRYKMKYDSFYQCILG